MRVQVRGRVNRERMHQISDAIADFLADVGATECWALNIYFTALDSETFEPIEFTDDQGRAIELMTIVDPRVVRRHRSKLRAIK